MTVSPPHREIDCEDGCCRQLRHHVARCHGTDPGARTHLRAVYEPCENGEHGADKASGYGIGGRERRTLEAEAAEDVEDDGAAEERDREDNEEGMGRTPDRV